MVKLFVNLKRFDVSRSLGGVSDVSDPRAWIEGILSQTAQNGAFDHEGLSITFLLPEAVLLAASELLPQVQSGHPTAIELGSQSVYREDVRSGKNFGAFSAARPASAVAMLGCRWTMVGHSEERRDIEGIIAAYDPNVAADVQKRGLARRVVDSIIGAEARCAAERKLKILLCVGENADERGDTEADELTDGVANRLAEQLDAVITQVTAAAEPTEIVIGYEPIWAIGPGKTPPTAAYIGAVSGFIRKRVQEGYGFTPAVVYGGGLKEENANAIGSVGTIDGGLVALTRFTGSIGFYPEEFARIVESFLEGSGTREGDQS